MSVPSPETQILNDLLEMGASLMAHGIIFKCQWDLLILPIHSRPGCRWYNKIYYYI